VDTSVPSSAAAPAAAGNSLGVEILSTGAATKPSDDNGGLKAVGPPNATPLPEAEKATGAPDAVNDIAPGTQPAAQAPNADGKKTKPAFDKSDESSSKHKKKKGLAKINPF
jgi:outer membrane protein assembly factor BamD